MYAVYEKDSYGRWYPLYAMRFSTRAAARAAIEKMNKGDHECIRYFVIRRVGGSQ